LSHGEVQWLEIGMVMAQDPALLLLDEPVAGMTGKEREITAQLLQRMARSRRSGGRARHGIRAAHRPQGDGAA
jgi:ABC-type uncharacterized transport system ATPase subunit